MESWVYIHKMRYEKLSKETKQNNIKYTVGIHEMPREKLTKETAIVVTIESTVPIKKVCKRKMAQISWSVCPWQAFPVWCNVTLAFLAHS
jgi:hypothetical protein